MPDLKQMPDEKRVDEATAYYEKLWKPTHNQWSGYDSYYQQTFDVWDKQEFKDRSYLRRSRGRNLIDHAVDSQMTYHPVVSRPAVGEGGDAKDRADKLREGLAAVIQDSMLKEMSLPWRTAAKYFTHYGYMVFEAPILDPCLMRERIDAKKRKRNETDDEHELRQKDVRTAVFNPIRINVPHPVTVMLDPSEKMPDEAVKVEVMPAYQVYELSVEKTRTRNNAEVFRLAGLPPNTPILLRHYWTRYWHSVKAVAQTTSGTIPQMLWTEKNPSGMLPFLHAAAGFGMEPVNGAGDPKYMAVGILHSVMDVLKAQAQSDSAKHNLLMKRSYVGMRTTRDPADVAQQLRGGIVQASADEIGELPTTDVDRWMFQVGQEYEQDIEEGTYSRTLGGVRIPGVSTVGQQAILNTTAGQKFVEPVVQLSHMASEVARRILRLVDTVPTLADGIGAHGHVIKRADIQGNYDAEVQFESIDPALDLQRREVGIREVQLNLQSLEDYLRNDKRVEDVSGYKRRLLEDAVEKHPAVHSRLAQQAAVGMDSELADTFTEAIQEEAAQVEQDGRRASTTGGPVKGSTENLRDVTNPLTPDVMNPPRQ